MFKYQYHKRFPIKDLKYIYVYILRQTPWHVNTTTSHHSKGLNVHLITVENTLKVQQQKDERKAPDTAAGCWESQSIELLLGGEGASHGSSAAQTKPVIQLLAFHHKLTLISEGL